MKLKETLKLKSKTKNGTEFEIFAEDTRGLKVNVPALEIIRYPLNITTFRGVKSIKLPNNRYIEVTKEIEDFIQKYKNKKYELEKMKMRLTVEAKNYNETIEVDSRLSDEELLEKYNTKQKWIDQARESFVPKTDAEKSREKTKERFNEGEWEAMKKNI